MPAAPWPADEIVRISIDTLTPYAQNSRLHSDAQVAQIANSIVEFGFTIPILISEDGSIIAGHGRVMAAKLLNMVDVPAMVARGWSEAKRRAYVIADNKLAENATWDDELLKLELTWLADEGFDLGLTGFNFEELDKMLGDVELPEQIAKGSLEERFGVPPFSVLDTRRGAWQDRKRAWNAKIGDNGESRENTLAGEGTVMADINNGVSILDAALAETLCRWFAKPGFRAFDPFAGDSVFGFVACSLGLIFDGIELRQEQADLNQSRLDKVGMDGKYYCDTSENMDAHIDDGTVDFVFSCPPYADLEVYSSDPRDLSTMSHSDFFEIYCKIIKQTYKKLRNNRFAVIVISEVRGKNGEYIGTVPSTIQAMQAAGYKFWNEIILVNTLGTLPQRAGKSMQASRKVGRTHQNVLVFFKGDQKNIAKEFGDIEGIDCEVEDE